MLVAVAPPGLHTYVVPPNAVKVVLLPLQIVKDGDAVMAGVGSALMVTTAVAVTAAHPPDAAIV